MATLLLFVAAFGEIVSIIEGRPIRVLELRSVHGAGGGPEKTILLGTAATDRTRFDVTVCYIRQRGDEQFDFDQRAAAANIPYVELEERRALDPSIWLTLRRLVRKHAIDIVHAHDYKTDLFAFLLAAVEPVVAMATAHGWTGHHARERRIYYPADKRILARLPCVIAVSSQIRDELVRHGASPDAVHVVLTASTSAASSEMTAG